MSYSSIIEETSSPLEIASFLNAVELNTPLGPMLAIGDEDVLYLLEFVDKCRLEKEISKLRIKEECAIVSGWTPPLRSIEKELLEYFQGKKRKFITPIKMLGSPFQKKVWNTLLKISPGKTQSYAETAKAIGSPNAYRAVANANGANQLAIIIPCHRVIQSNGKLGGYGGGKEKKKWLLELEKNFYEF